MNDVSRLSLEERVLVLAPTAADAALSQSLLADAGMACHICADVYGLCTAYKEGAGTLLLTEEVLGASKSHCLWDVLHQQPDWSDVPILLLTSQGADSPVAVEAMEQLGNVTLLERPVRINTLVSALRTALRARRRQYELRKRLEERRASEAQYRFLVNTVPALVWSCKPDGTTDFHNNRWFEYTGLPPNSMDSEDWKTVVHPDDLDRAVERWGRSVRSGEPYHIEYRLRRASDGEYRWWLVEAVPMRDQEGRIVRWFGTCTDIHDRRVAEEALREADRRKDEFLATLAHELRNPLAPVRNALQILKLSPGPEAREQARTLMERQVNQMVHLVDDLLDVSRISTGKLVLRREHVTLTAVVNSAVETSRPIIDRLGHKLSVTLPKQPILVDADPTRLAQVFSNLLNNSAKYTEPGGHIWLTAERQGSNVVLSVRDTGIGIAADQLPRLFGMFSQLESSLERSQGGLGIGLTLVKRLVEMHGGTVEASSEGSGRGSEFVVRLPIVVAASGPQLVDRADEPAHSRSRLRILIVDDNQDGADSLAMMLRIMGNDTRTAYDGQEGVEVAGKFRPNVILFDIGLPKLNGYEACRLIRQQTWGGNVVLIAVTGWGREEDHRRSHEAGFDQHMIKPVDPQALMRLLAESQTVTRP